MKLNQKATLGVAGVILAGTLGTAAWAGEATALPPERAAGKSMYIIGSTLMKAYTAALTEKLSREAGLPQATIANKGSSRGIEAFCEGVGLDTPDVVAVSRRMRSAELDRCREHGVTDIIEIQVGYEANVVVSRIDDQDYPLNLVSFYKGVAGELPEGFEFIPNTATRWKEVDKRLPDTEIRVIIPVPALGGRAFVEDRILQGACRDIFEIKTIFSAEERVKQCVNLRKDGRIVELDAPYDTNVVKALAAAPAGTLAVLPMRFATEHADALKLQSINGVMPGRQTVANRSYELIRPLYYFVKKAHVKNYKGEGPVEGLREFITEVTRESAMGPDGYMTHLGLMPLDDQMREHVRETALTLTPVVR